MPQSNTPPVDENTPPEQTTVDPREALNMKKAQIQLLEAELSEVDAKLDAEFLDSIDSRLTPEELEMRFDEDVRSFLALVEEKREEFYREKLDELKGRIEGMRGEVIDEEETLNIDDAKRAFLAEHPEADWAAIVDFFKNDMSARQKEEIQDLELGEMMEKVYVLYSKKNKKAPEQVAAVEPESILPPDLNNVPSQAPVGDPSPVAKDDGYLKSIGLRR